MDLGTIVGVVFPLLTVITGGACVLQFSVTRTLRDNNGDLKERVSILESEIAIEKTANASLQSQVDALQKVVTGEVQLQAILTLLEGHDRASVTAHARIEMAIEQGTATMLAAVAER